MNHTTLNGRIVRRVNYLSIRIFNTFIKLPCFSHCLLYIHFGKSKKDSESKRGKQKTPPPLLRRSHAALARPVPATLFRFCCFTVVWLMLFFTGVESPCREGLCPDTSLNIWLLDRQMGLDCGDPANTSDNRVAVQSRLGKTHVQGSGSFHCGC